MHFSSSISFTSLFKVKGKELSASSGRRRTKTQVKGQNAGCVQFLTPRLLKSSYSQLYMY